MKFVSAQINKRSDQTYIRLTLEFASCIFHPSPVCLPTSFDTVQNYTTRCINLEYSPKTNVPKLKRTLSLPISDAVNPFHVSLFYISTTTSETKTCTYENATPAFPTPNSWSGHLKHWWPELAFRCYFLLRYIVVQKKLFIITV